MKTVIVSLSLLGFGLIAKPIATSWHLATQLRHLEQNQASLPIRLSRNLMDWPKEVEQAARLSGIQKILRINSDERSIQWESSLSSAYLFLDQLGPVEKFHVVPSGAQSGSLKITAVFSTASKQQTAASKATRDPKSLRNPFLAVSQSRSAPSGLRPDSIENKKQEQERQQQEEELKWAHKKQELTSRLALTGLMNNGRESMAVIDDRGPARRTWVVKVGDALGEARVVSIDEKRGAVTLDVDSKIQITLTAGSQGHSEP